jgi:hypothetical protein
MPSVENFDLYKTLYIRQHMTSVGILCKLCDQEHLEGIVSLHLKSVGRFLYILLTHEISNALIWHQRNLS